MRKNALMRGLLVCALIMAASAAPAGMALKSESGWFDFENCAFCKNLAAHDGLLQNSTWENHPISNGLMTIITVPDEYADKMAQAEAAMAEIGGKIQSGEVNPMTLTMCTHCQTFGMMLMGGAVEMEEVKGGVATVTLMTSDDEAVVKHLQDMAKRDTEEMAKLMGGDHGH